MFRLWAALVTVGLTACTSLPPAVRMLVYPEGVLYVTNSPTVVQREGVKAAVRQDLDPQLLDATVRFCGFWDAAAREGWALDRPDVIAHERLHMLGVTHEHMPTSLRHTCP